MSNFSSSILLPFNSINYIRTVSGMQADNNTKSWLMGFVSIIYDSDLDEEYSKPMAWIGMYITLASLCCILAMVVDLFHGLRTRKLWFPSKYFTINATSLVVIGVAMKLPVDLSTSMPGVVDQVAKLGSVAFMCTMMANLLPCLAVMDNNTMLTNITALGVMLITLVVNVCIQINTGVIACKDCMRMSMPKRQLDQQIFIEIPEMVFTGVYPPPLLVIGTVSYSSIAIIYVTMLLVLLIIHVSSSLAILKSKQIIESKYQQAHQTASAYVNQQSPKDGESLIDVNKLEEHVSKYWIMAETGNPQLVIACFATTTASGVICALAAILHTLTMGWTILLLDEYGSDYDWSMPLILMVQFVGVLLATVAPLCRCFASLSFKVSYKSIKVFKVESYWTDKLCDWKNNGSIPLPFRSYKRKVVIKNLKSLILNFSLNIQKGVVVACKIIALIPFFFLMCFVYCRRTSGKKTNNVEGRWYVLQVEDEMEFDESTVEGLEKSINRMIKKSEKKQPKYLMNLISTKSSKDFQGVRTFDNNDQNVQCSESKVEHRDCWSLTIVTLATIAVSLRKIKKKEVDTLLKSVREGLDYVTLVEKNLNATDEYVNIQKVAKRLWQEVDVCHKWLGIKLENIAAQVNANDFQGDATLQVVKLFSKEANKISDSDSKFTSICANSMSCVTKSITEYDNESQKKEFDVLISSRIADIMAACLTNLPQVIAKKCHTSSIEKREACIEAAAELLGETKEIIRTLPNPSRHVPHMKPEDLPFIEKWYARLST